MEPSELTKAIMEPKELALDGEFWFGAGAWNEAIKVSSRYPLELIRWDDFKYVVFDCIIKDAPFDFRYSMLKALIPPDHPRITTGLYFRKIDLFIFSM